MYNTYMKMLKYKTEAVNINIYNKGFKLKFYLK